MKPWGAALTDAVPAGINKTQAATRDLAIDDIGAKKLGGIASTIPPYFKTKLCGY
jgi:hypothetical protein